ncbi:MAG: hypothetical protein AAFP10_08745 [Pseudomonadota bacterium]
MVINKTAKLIEKIFCYYKSLDFPDFTFVKEMIKSKPYDSLIKKIGCLFDIEETTDVNDDVSFCYIIKKNESQWVIELSMLGLYAVVFRITDDGGAELLVSPINQQEEKIAYLLNEYGFERLSENILKQPVNLRLNNTEPENTCFYQAFFSDTDQLPWVT